MNRRPEIPQNTPLSLLVSVVLALTFATTPSFAGVKLQFIEPNPPHGSDTQPYRGMKVCLVVKDARHESIVKTQFCGVMRRGPAELFALLENQETLETIMAYSIADSLEFAGYEVVKVYPSRPDRLSSEPRQKPKGMKKDLKLSMKSQPKKEHAYAQTFRDLESFGEGVTLNEISGTVAAQGGKGWTNGADAVLEVTIDAFASEMIQRSFRNEFFAWSTATLVVAPGESAPQGALTTVEAHGWGSSITPNLVGIALQSLVRKGMKVEINSSYRRLVSNIETVLLSDEFFAAMKAASGTANHTENRTDPRQQSAKSSQHRVAPDSGEQPNAPSQTDNVQDAPDKLRTELEERMKNAQP